LGTILLKHGAAALAPRRDIVGRMPRKQPRWSAPLTRPIAVKDGATLRTLHDARAFVLSLPKGVQLEQSWQRVTELLSAAAEGDGDIEAATRQIELSLFLQAKWTFPK